ncbi:MAG: T9SS type A sorting domain-containing protein [Bacteroidetes bacterium]|nr:T9SS type A sorting domain-containing protein [Bacteroidota bacterium]
MKKIIAILIFQFSLFNIPFSYAQSWQWFNTIGGGGQAINPDIPDEQVADMVTDSAGNVYVCGRFIGQGSPTINGTPITSFGGYDIFVAKFNCLGNLLWVKTAGNFDYGDDAMSLVLDNFGHLYVTGEVYSSPFSSYCNFMGDTIIDDVNDMFLCKMDTSGNLLWVKWAAPNTGSFNTGSLPYKLNLTNGNPTVLFNLPVAGAFWSGDSINTRGIYISEFDTAGNLLQVNTISSSNWGLFSYKDYILDNLSNQYVTGYFNSDSIEVGGQTLYKLSNSGISYYDCFIAKFDSSGFLIWIKQIGQPGGGSALTYSLLSVNDSLIAVSLICSPGFVFGSDTILNINTQGVTVILLLGSAGNVQWARNPQNQFTIKPTGKMSLDNNNDIVFATQFGLTINFGSYSVSSPSGGGICVASINTSGNWTNAISIEGLSSFNIPLSTETDIFGNILVAGGFDGPLIFNGNQISSAGGYTDGFIAKYGLQCSVGLDEDLTASSVQLKLFPNPATNHINLQTTGFKNSTITILNTMGQTVFTSNLSEAQNQTTINISKLSSGVYFIKVNDNENTVTLKFVKQ